MTLKFLGAAKTVTGSRTLLSYNGKKVLIDCGLFQGPKEVRLKNWETFSEAPDIDYVILTHAHIDHSGFLPKIVKDGFKGKIICSEATFDLCKIMLIDSAYLQEEDALFAKKKRHSRYDQPLPLYNQKDAQKALDLFETYPAEEWVELFKGFSFKLIPSGHILGSRFVQVAYDNSNGVKIISFSGDIGHKRQYVLRGPKQILESDFLVLESTYGDRCHSKTDSLTELEGVVNETFNKGGVLVIPSFAVGRTQEIIYLIKILESQNRIPKIPLYVDSPMANKATNVYLKYPEELKSEIINGQLEAPFSTNDFQTISSADDSMLLCMKDDEPMIIISAAGMLSGGRILHHIKTRLPHAKNTILFVGYQAAETKGRLLQSGLLSIRIHHTEVSVEADIRTIGSLSAHADSNDILGWLKGFSKLPKKIFLNHGEQQALNALAYRIKHQLNIECIIPEQNDQFDLD